MIFHFFQTKKGPINFRSKFGNSVHSGAEVAKSIRFIDTFTTAPQNSNCSMTNERSGCSNFTPMMCSDDAYRVVGAALGAVHK